MPAYHAHNGVDGYRTMQIYLERIGICLSRPTVHKYMNTELGLRSIVRPKKPEYVHGKPHKVFENKLNQDFHADAINQKWCMEFAYATYNHVRPTAIMDIRHHIRQGVSAA